VIVSVILSRGLYSCSVLVEAEVSFYIPIIIAYGSWIYNYLCNRCLSPLMLWVRLALKARCLTLCDKVCQWLAAGRWISPGSSTNKTDRHDITEILLKVALNIVNHKPVFNIIGTITHQSSWWSSTTSQMLTWWLRRVWRYQSKNNDIQNAHKTTDRATRTPLKNRGWTHVLTVADNGHLLSMSNCSMHNWFHKTTHTQYVINWESYLDFSIYTFPPLLSSFSLYCSWIRHTTNG
jgi:hypothetical protein